MRFQVPQFTDIEDKIIGPLTVKQFIYYVIAILFLVPIYAVVDLPLFITFAIPIIGIAALFAHLHFYGQTFAAIISHAMSFYFGGQFFLWRRGTLLKPMRIAGEEFELLPLRPERVFMTPALTAIAQTLETEGKIITEDVADPLVEELRAPQESAETPPQQGTAANKPSPTSPNT